jgi:hypothetical protein
MRALSPRYHKVQREAQALYQIWSEIGTDDSLLHPMWREAGPLFGELVSRGVPPDFLGHPIVRHMLYRTGYGELERAEVAYLEATEPRLRDLCRSYREPRLGEPVFDCPPTGGSVSSLNKLYYFARIAETVPLAQLRTVMEFGGGYGLMCHVLEELVDPRPTYIMIDLPELLALQYVFLRGGSRLSVTAHTETPVRVRQGTVNLVPIQLLASSEFECDLFISTFALSETPVSLQRFIAEREFFGASCLYLTGQNTEDELWKQYSLQEMDAVRRTAKELFDSVRVEPLPGVSAWELTASRAGRGASA